MNKSPLSSVRNDSSGGGGRGASSVGYGNVRGPRRR